MPTAPFIRDAEPGDLETLIDIFCDSFTRDPMLNWVFPQVDMYPDFFRLLIEDVFLPSGVIHMDDKRRAAALWLPPEERFEIPPRMELLGLGLKLVLREGPAVLRRIRQQGAVFDKHLPTEPHYYLQFLGCRQSDQHQGIGGTVLERGIRMCDEREIPAYLESSNALNVPLYEHHGFEVKAVQRVSKNGPAVWFMWREPR